ncbi:MAG: TIGR03756 family integrating conjugative element protein, partial [Chromatiaceae bacterium]|nr:TIGR03756 family integrating conjugative element protein [Chromatiaceae bacterium]
MRRHGLAGLILVLMLPLSVASNAATVTTPGIVAQTTAATFTCMRWMPVGLCFWLRCSWRGCRVRTSLKVG